MGKSLEELAAEAASLAVPGSAPAAPAAPAATQDEKAEDGTFDFCGAVGGPFSIDSKGGFGDQSTAAHFVPPGIVSVSGRPVTITRWKDKNIKGVLPDDIGYGPVVVTVRDKKFTGHFGPTK